VDALDALQGTLLDDAPQIKAALIIWRFGLLKGLSQLDRVHDNLFEAHLQQLLVNLFFGIWYGHAIAPAVGRQ
jgi:hypothetical protein